MSARYESSPVDPAPLGKPLKFEFSGKVAPNRFMKSAMTERLSSWSASDLASRGIPSANLINVFKRWGEGGIGCIVSGNTMIDYKELEAAGNPIIPQDAPLSGERFEQFKKLATAAKAHGMLLIGQVSHPGRQVPSQIQPNPISASDVQLEGNVMGMTFGKPRAATQEDIDHVIKGFAHAAKFMEATGYDGVQLHGAHGYLLAQFISQTTNKRTDKYGGSLENRGRIIIEIAHAIRAVTKPSFILSIKLNSVEFQQAGFQPEEAQELVALLEQNKFDFVELSGGTYEELAFVHKRDSSKKREAFFLEFAEQIVPGLKHTKVYVTGGFKTAGAMVDALNTVDGVGLARPLCSDPRLPNDILSGKVKGATKMLFDENDFGMTNVVAGTQIRQMGRDLEPFDGSDEKQKAEFQQDMGEWADAMGKDTTGNMYGYVDTNHVAPVPYATAAPAS